MKKVMLIISMVSAMMLSSCGNSDTNTKSSNEKSSEQTKSAKKPEMLTQQSFEKMILKYGITLYANMKFKSIKKKSEGDIVARYKVDDLSEDSNKKVKEYIANELLKLKNKGWGIQESLGMAMKKEGNYTVGIQITQGYFPDLELHTIIYSLGKVY